MRTFIPSRLLPFTAMVALLIVPAIVTHAAASPNTWTVTGSLSTGRSVATATPLPNGKVLIAGGADFSSYFPGDTSTSSAELYDPAIGTWTAISSLHIPREGHSATLLPNGKVLVAGGVDAQISSVKSLNSAELYDPNTGTWIYTSSLHTAGTWSTLLLPTGNVLAISQTPELYNPQTNTWTLTGSPKMTLSGEATLLLSGKVLVSSGYSNGVITSAELYDPQTGAWVLTGNFNIPRYSTPATLLSNGKVLIAGGQDTNGNWLTSAEVYDPQTGTWMLTGSLNIARFDNTATLLSNGQVLVVGGDSNGFTTASTELYDPATGSWTTTGSLNTARWRHIATLLSTGTVLVTGGQALTDEGDSGLTSTELYHPGTALVVTPGSGTIGQTIQLIGSGFGPSETVKIYADSTSNPVAYSAVTSSSGGFTISGPIYAISAGPHALIAVGQNSGLTSQTTLIILPKLVLSLTVGTVGTTVHTTGMGFGSHESIQIAWDAPAKLLGSATSNGSGSFSGKQTFSFTVPKAAGRGTHTITAIGQTTHVVTTAQFTVK